MTIDEINQASDMLLSALKEVGLTWLQDAIIADINDGALEAIPVSALRASDQLELESLTVKVAAIKVDSSTRARSPRIEEQFLRHREYTPEEKLLAIIAGIEETVIHASDIEVVLNTEFLRDAQLRLLSFVDGETQQQIDLGLHAVAERNQSSEKLKKLLAELRLEVQG